MLLLEVGLVAAIAGIDGAHDFLDPRSAPRQILGFGLLKIRIHRAAQVHNAVTCRTPALICASPAHPAKPHFSNAAQPDNNAAAAMLK